MNRLNLNAGLVPKNVISDLNTSKPKEIVVNQPNIGEPDVEQQAVWDESRITRNDDIRVGDIIISDEMGRMYKVVAIGESGITMDPCDTISGSDFEKGRGHYRG